MTAMPQPSQFANVARQDEHLLPPNATPLERALSGSDHRILSAPTWIIRAFWSADRCPVHLLPYLAAAWSVDEWDPAWSEPEKRSAIRQAVWLHQHKGTVGALKRALARLRLGVTVSEWWQHDAEAYTFRLGVALERGATWSLAQAEQMYRVALRAKNVRSHLDRITVLSPPATDAPVRVGIASVTRVVCRPILEPVAAITAPNGYLRIGVAIRTRVLSRAVALGAV